MKSLDTQVLFEFTPIFLCVENSLAQGLQQRISFLGTERVKKYPIKMSFFSPAAATVYLAQELLSTKLPYGRQHFLLLPFALGTASAYIITRRNTRICQEMWMAMEEKHSVITPMHGNGLF